MFLVSFHHFYYAVMDSYNLEWRAFRVHAYEGMLPGITISILLQLSLKILLSLNLLVDVYNTGRSSYRGIEIVAFIRMCTVYTAIRRVFSSSMIL